MNKPTTFEELTLDNIHKLKSRLSALEDDELRQKKINRIKARLLKLEFALQKHMKYES